MANPEHLAILEKGMLDFLLWRSTNPQIRPDLSGAMLFKRNLMTVDFSECNLSRARLGSANLLGANFRGANLQEASLNGAILISANFSGADLSGADLMLSNMVETNLDNANLLNCRIFGASIWGVSLNGAIQQNLIITQSNEPAITVDNLEVAQFIYLLLNNEKIRGVIDTVARKAVLILGRFTPERKSALDAIREELRKRDYVPILFDFDKPATRDTTETVRTLAHLSRFIIADITDPSSIPLELQAIVPDLAVPVQPLLLSGQREFSMFVDLRKKYHWVLATHQYTDIAYLLASLGDKVIVPAEQKARELDKR
ncbi:MAG: pentapeptide repeat-containing protein [Chloroflexi bacterium]|nr:pentapeptide repeat-containing protein [Chloroflexota bacterium]